MPEVSRPNSVKSTGAPPIEPIELGGVRFAADRLTEVEDGRVMALVMRHEIRSITLRHDFRSNHPVLQVIFGFVLIAVGLVPVRHLASWFRGGGIFFAVEIGLVVFAVIGAWLVFEAPRRGYQLDVGASSGRKKPTFHRKTGPAELRAFVAEAAARFEYEVVDDLPRG